MVLKAYQNISNINEFHFKSKIFGLGSTSEARGGGGGGLGGLRGLFGGLGQPRKPTPPDNIPSQNNESTPSNRPSSTQQQPTFGNGGRGEASQRKQRPILRPPI